MTFTNPHEQFCFDTATHFNAVRGRGFKRSVEVCKTFTEAQAYAAKHGDKRTMIYAINDLGNSAHICNL